MQKLGSMPDGELEKLGHALKIETAALAEEDTLDKVLVEEKKPRMG